MLGGWVGGGYGGVEVNSAHGTPPFSNARAERGVGSRVAKILERDRVHSIVVKNVI